MSLLCMFVRVSQGQRPSRAQGGPNEIIFCLPCSPWDPTFAPWTPPEGVPVRSEGAWLWGDWWSDVCRRMWSFLGEQRGICLRWSYATKPVPTSSWLVQNYPTWPQCFLHGGKMMQHRPLLVLKVECTQCLRFSSMKSRARLVIFKYNSMRCIISVK